MALDGEAVRLVANLLQQVQPRMVRRQRERLVAVGKDDLLEAGLALGALGDANEQRAVHSLLSQHVGSDADLTLAAVDHQQVGRRILAGHDARDAARQSFAERRIVVAACRRLDVEAPVFPALHGEAIEDHAACHGRFAHGVTHVEALDPLHRRRQTQRFLQRGEPLVLRSLLRELLPDRELCVLDRHRDPYAPLAAGVSDELHLVSRLRRQHVGKDWVVDALGDDRRRCGPFEIVLHQECADDLDQ